VRTTGGRWEGATAFLSASPPTHFLRRKPSLNRRKNLRIETTERATPWKAAEKRTGGRFAQAGSRA